MESLYLLIPIALLFAILVIWLLIWAVNNGQYDDLEKDGWHSLNDEMKPLDKQPNDDKSD